MELIISVGFANLWKEKVNENKYTLVPDHCLAGCRCACTAHTNYNDRATTQT